MRTCWLSLALAACLVVTVGAAAEGDLAETYTWEIHPLMVRTCGGCHGAEPKDNDLDLAGFATSEALLGRPAVLEHVIERLHLGDMPPREAPQPSDAEREQLLGWFTAALDAEAAVRAGDPGPVMLRRLSNVEYDNAVRDLTGIDMRPTQALEFPPDAVGGEGFANVGEAMPVTPVLVERYLKAARDVAARAVLLPTGFQFSASPDRPEWTAEAEKALRAFHSRYAGPDGAPPLEQHLAAMLRHRERLASGGPDAIAAVAAEEKLNATYLTALWTGLADTAASPTEDIPRAVQWLENVIADLPSPGPPPATIGLVREKWRAATTDPKPVMQAIKTLQDRLFWNNYGKHNVLAVGNGFPWWEDTLRVVAREQVEGPAREPVFRLVAREVAPAQPGTFVIWDRLRLEGGEGPLVVLAEQPELRAAIEASGLRFGVHPQGQPVPPMALVTQAASEVVIDLRKLPQPLLEGLALPRFLRADVWLDEGSPESATVQALLVNQPGRTPVPSEWKSGDPLVIEEPEPRVAQLAHPRVAAERARPAAKFRGLFPPAVVFEPIIPRDAQGSLFMFRRDDEPLRRLLLDDAGRAELERLWADLHFVSEDSVSHRRMYAELMSYYRYEPSAGMMFFHIQTLEDQVDREERAFRAAQALAEPAHLEQLLAFAARAWRRPLAAEEREAILAGYKADRSDGMEHDPAFRAALARVLASPWFLYRVEEPGQGPNWQPVTGVELATRLSFLVWDSIPDEALLAAAARLHEPAVMEEQLRRMLEDGRIRGMAEEFGARWLGVRDFVANHGRSVKDFPEFTPAVRDSLAEEPVRFFEDLLANDRPVIDLLTADAVVVNDVLAMHYGIPGVTGPEWRRVEKVSAHGRGGLLGFGAVLAKQSAAARTSPIKRGAWVVEMLGERLPNPPADVPPLPETPPAGLTVREITEFHTKDPRCSGCHSRIDPFGITLGQFDALGRLRPAAELRPGETRATLRDGTVIDDFAGLQTYIAGPRRDDLLRALARKLTGYALGRAVLPSDRPLVDTLMKTMAGGGRWSEALLVITQSEQFRCIRPTASVAAASP